MKTKFSKLFVTILIVAAVTCCGALGVFAADDANADTAVWVIVFNARLGHGHAALTPVITDCTTVILKQIWDGYAIGCCVSVNRIAQPDNFLAAKLPL